MINLSISGRTMLILLRLCLSISSGILMLSCSSIEAKNNTENSSLAPARITANNVSSDFSSHKHTEKTIQLDFNQDGAIDRAYLLSPMSRHNAQFKSATHLNLWPDKIKQQQKVLKHDNKQSLLLIQLSNATNKKQTQFLLYSDADITFLNSVSADDLSSITYKALIADFPELKNKARGDALSLLTEAGIEAFIYWNGTNLVFFEPEMIP